MARDCWTLVDLALGHVSKHGGNVLLKGVPGTGKSFAARNTAVDPSRGMYAMTMTEETPYTDIEGYTRIINGDTQWVEGIGTGAWVNGCRLVIEEVDRAAPDCKSSFHSLLDNVETAALTVDDPTDPHKKITIRPATGFHCVMTTNVENIDDGEVFHSAFRDRIGIVITVDRVHPKALGRLPEYMRTAASNLILSDDPSRRTSIRSMLQFMSLTDSGIDIEQAGFMVWQERADELVKALKINKAKVHDKAKVYANDKKVEAATVAAPTGDDGDWDDDDWDTTSV